MLIILCICWLQGLKMLLWTSNLVCCIKMIWISPQALALLRISPVFLNRSTHTHSAQEQAWIQLQKCCENNRGKQMKCYSPFTLPTQWEKCWAHGNVLALRREQEELIIIPKLSQKLSMCCSTAWKLLTDRCSCHLTLDIPRLTPPCTVTEKRQFLKWILCITLQEPHFFLQGTQVLKNHSKNILYCLIFWLLGRICTVPSQQVIYSEAFSQSEELLPAPAELLGKFAFINLDTDGSCVCCASIYTFPTGAQRSWCWFGEGQSIPATCSLAEQGAPTAVLFPPRNAHSTNQLQILVGLRAGITRLLSGITTHTFTAHLPWGQTPPQITTKVSNALKLAHFPLFFTFLLFTYLLFPY